MVIYYARVFFTLQFVNVNILLNIHLFTYFVSPLLRYGSFCLKFFYRVFILEIFQKKGGHPTDPCRLQREEARRPLQALAGDPAIPADRNILKGRKSHEKTAPFCTCNAPVCHLLRAQFQAALLRPRQRRRIRSLPRNRSAMPMYWI